MTNSATSPVRYFPVGSEDGSPEGFDFEQALRTHGGGRTPDPLIGMIWAQTVDGVIGRDGTMPWHLSEDLAHFKAMTLGHPVIMGRRTWESFPAAYRPLPGRTNIVISSRPGLAAEIGPSGAVVVPSLEAALEAARQSAGSEQIWIVGGGTVYQAAARFADAAVVTVIDSTVEGDTLAPRLGPEWTFDGVSPASGWNTSANGMQYRFALWLRSRDVTQREGQAPLA